MHGKFFLLFGLFTSFLLIGCVSTNEANTNPGAPITEISLSPPSGWEQFTESDSNGIYVAMFSKEANLCFFSLSKVDKKSFLENQFGVESSKSEDIGINEISKFMVDDAEKNEYVILKSGEALFSGKNGVYVELRTNYSKEIGNFLSSSVIVVDRNNIFIWGYSGPLEDCEPIKNELDLMINSVQLN